MKVKLHTGTVVEVSTLREASDAVLAMRDADNIGSSDFYDMPGVGQVRDKDGVIVAAVSYNGRVWTVNKAGMGTLTEIVLEAR